MPVSYPSTEPTINNNITVSLGELIPIQNATNNLLDEILDKLPGVTPTTPNDIQPVSGPFLTNSELRSSAIPVSGNFYQSTQPVSGSFLTDSQLRASAVAISGPFLTDAQLRATPPAVSVSNTVPVTGTFFQATQPVSGPITDAQLRASPIAVSGTFFPGTQPVSGPLTDTQLRATAISVLGPLTDAQLRATALSVTGSFFPATQPVSGPLTDTQLRAVAVPVSGSFFQATQPVSGPLTDSQLRATPVAVSGTFFQATQPVSGPLTDAQLRASAISVLGPLTDAQLRAAAINVSGPLTDVQLRASAVPVSGTFFQVTQPVSLGNSTGKTVVMKTGTLTTTAVTADQVVLTYTVTAGKTFYLQYIQLQVRLTTFAATATNFGDSSLESPAATKLYTQMNAHAGTPNDSTPIIFDEPQPFAAGTVIRIVCTPAAVTSFTWRANLGGYEK